MPPWRQSILCRVEGELGRRPRRPDRAGDQFVINSAIYALQYDVVKDLEPVTLLASSPFLIVAKNSLPAKDLRELIAWRIHKSQGSEYPAVVIPIMTQHYPMLQWNLLYTGVTRGKKLVVLVGQKKAIAIAVRNVSGRRRWSKLREWLRMSGG
jgi:UvrD-like helicase C-terminal domain/Tripartite tricarboxylate transporter family receptor